MKKKYLCTIVFLLVPLFIYFIFFQYRHFYKVNDIFFTFWKTRNGCYIMPYKYYGVKKPKDNYIKASNLGGVVIFIGEETKLYIFPTYIYELGANKLTVNLSSFKYDYFPYINEICHISEVNKKMKTYKDLNYPYIDIYIREMYVKIMNSRNYK